MVQLRFQYSSIFDVYFTGVVDVWKVWSAMECVCLGSVHWHIRYVVPWQQFTASYAVFCPRWLRTRRSQQQAADQCLVNATTGVLVTTRFYLRMVYHQGSETRVDNRVNPPKKPGKKTQI